MRLPIERKSMQGREVDLHQAVPLFYKERTMSFVNGDTQPSVKAGDRTFTTAPQSAKKKKQQDSDIPGFQQEVDDSGNPTDTYVSGESTYTRTDALRALAQNEGLQNLTDEELEQLLEQIKEKGKKQQAQYQPQVDRVGV